MASGCLAFVLANSIALTVTAAGPSTSVAKGHEMSWESTVEASSGGLEEQEWGGMECGGALGWWGHPECLCLASLIFLHQQRWQQGKGTTCGTPWTRHGLGQAELTPLPRPLALAPLLALPSELPGSCFFPSCKGKDKALVFLWPGHSGLNHFINHRAALGGDRSQAGCKEEARKPAWLCWCGRDGSSSSAPLGKPPGNLTRG